MIPIISIFFALALPVFALRKLDRTPPRRPWLYSVGSFCCCTAAAIAELLTVKRRLLAGDIGGIEDTIGAVLALCISLLIAVLVLNLMLLELSCGEKHP